MRTTLDLNEHLVKEGLRWGRMRTKTELIHASLDAFIRRKKLEKLTALAGSGATTLTQKELRRMRRAA